MSIPRVTVLFGNGNLLADISAVDGIAGLICSGTATGAMPLKTPKQIFDLKDLAALGVSGLPVGTVAAVSGNMSIGSVGTNGDVYAVTVGALALGSYTKVAGDTTTAAIATAIRAAVNALTSTHGYTAGGTASNVTLTAPVSSGSSLNGVTCTITFPGGSSGTVFSGGVTEVVNSHLYRQVKEYYDEVGGRQELWIMTVADTVTMTQMLDKNTADHAPLLLSQANGRIRLLAVARKPNVGYNGGTDFIDNDVPTAVSAAKTLAEDQNDKLKFLRVLIEGCVANANSTNYYQPTTAENGFAGVVLGGDLADGSASLGSLLGRACRYGAHIKVGKVANGALKITNGYIGNKAIAQVSNLAYLHGLGYISLVTHPGKAGLYWGIDRMASTDDYRLLAYGRVVDKAATICAAVYVDMLESEIEMDGDGRITAQEVAYLRAIVSQQIKALMGDQISGFEVLVPEDQNLITTGKLTVQLRVQPLGYASFIEVTIGLTATV